jgi:hypothetical protein
MKRFVPYILLALLPRVARAGGVLNILLAGAIAVLSSSASPTAITYSNPSATLTSASTTCTGKGGIPPYVYGWSWASGGAGISIGSSASATTNFTVSGAVANTTYSGVAQCLVSDARPISAPYADVSVSLTRIPLLPPSAGTATLVAGFSSPNLTGYSTSIGIGSLSPSTDYNGHGVPSLLCDSSSGTLSLDVFLPSSNSGYVTGLSINGTLYLTSSATYSYTGAAGIWTWTTSCPLSSGGSYPVFYY